MLAVFIRLLYRHTVLSFQQISIILSIELRTVQILFEEASAIGCQLQKRGNHLYWVDPRSPFLLDVLYTYLDNLSSELLLHLCWSSPSTNLWASTYLSQQKDDRRCSVFLCELQTAGRGQYGRTWDMCFLDSLCMTYVWWPNMNASSSAQSALTLMVGYWIVQALSFLGGKDIFLKWPNDIWSSSGKIGGVLVERSVSGHYLIGIGLNIYRAPLKGSDALTSVFSIMPSRYAIFSQIMTLLHRGLNHPCSLNTWSYIKEDWLSYHCLHEHHVLLSNQYAGQIVGLDNSGSLMIKRQSGHITPITTQQMVWNNR